MSKLLYLALFEFAKSFFATIFSLYQTYLDWFPWITTAILPVATAEDTFYAATWVIVKGEASQFSPLLLLLNIVELLCKELLFPNT